MKYILLPILLAVASVNAEAQIYNRKTSTPVAANYGGSSYSQHAVSGALGFYAGGPTTWVGTRNNATANASPSVSGLFGVGGDYEYLWSNELTMGGIFRYYSTSDTTSANVEETVRMWTLGGMVKAYYHANMWSAYLGTGFGIIAPTYKLQTGGTTTDTDINTGFGFYFVPGLLYKINDQVSIGVENLRAMGIGEKIQGWAINDFMFKGRFTF